MNGKKEQILVSKSKIIEGTFRLLKLYTFDELTLNEILDEANISKRTFYRYFSNKQDILNYYYDDFITNYRSLESEILHQSSLNGVLGVTLDYFYQNRHYLRILIKNQKFYLLLEKFNRAAVRIYQSIDAPWHIKSKTPLELTDSLLFIVGGYSNIISSWLTEENPRNPQEIAEHINNIFINVSRNLEL